MEQAVPVTISTAIPWSPSDADTGALKLHYQFMPHDEIDWDAAQIPVLSDIAWKDDRARSLWANRNGVMYVLDRVTGQR